MVHLASVRARYQNVHAINRAESNEISEPPVPPTIQTILDHRSTRSFLPDAPLPPNLLEILVAAAQSAPTSSMLQTWSVVAVTDKTVKSRIGDLAGNQQFIRDAPLFLLFCADLNRLTGITSREKETLGEPWMLDKIDMLIMPTIDAGMAAQNASLAAEALGLGICYVGAVRNSPREISELLGLPDRVLGLFGMAVGYPDPGVPTSVKPRIAQREVLHLEKWDDGGQQERIKEYDGVLAEYYNDDGKLGRDIWSRHCASRVSRKDLNGREVLRAVIEERGFPLD